ncbi:MAG TPA: hypothetical protein VFV19_17840 [Candidatus Polarisedimenticolaceae bacterium]|nr:hypothetical protein [Candidatus Polarisedimenticolaceae bacterium]
MTNRVDLTLCCPEAQCDGVPCPTLGRSCETCERALAAAVRDEHLPSIRPPGRD